MPGEAVTAMVKELGSQSNWLGGIRNEQTRGKPHVPPVSVADGYHLAILPWGLRRGFPLKEQCVA